LIPLLDATGLVDDTDGAEVGGGEFVEDTEEVALQEVGGVVLLPGSGDEELLESADSGATGQGDGLNGLAVEVGQQATAVVSKWAVVRFWRKQQRYGAR
jgi:hypothetical protein